ncbi:MAG: GNAT family N-acetyltransferase, partial [Rhodospirillales bacterium]
MDKTLRLEINNFSRGDWRRLVCGFGDLSLLQCWEYAEAKAKTGPWRVERGVFFEGDDHAGAFQALIRPMPGPLPGGLAWINRGPLWRRRNNDGGSGDKAKLAAMITRLSGHYAGERGMYLRIAPPVEAGSAAAVAALDCAMVETSVPGWASARLDLRAPLDEIRSNLKSKWRGHLNKGERAAMEVRSGSGPELFETFLDHHRGLIVDRGFDTSLTPDLLGAMQELLAEDSKMTVFLAYKDNELLGSVLIARYGDTAEYLAGNTTDDGRRNSAGQVLLWRALAEMKDRGCAALDLSGMDEVLTPRGIYQFKEGLSGVPYRLVPELEAGGGGIMGRLVR